VKQLDKFINFRKGKEKRKEFVAKTETVIVVKISYQISQLFGLYNLKSFNFYLSFFLAYFNLTNPSFHINQSISALLALWQ